MIGIPSVRCCVSFIASDRSSTWGIFYKGRSFYTSLQKLSYIYISFSSKHILQARILDSVVFKRDMEVGRQEGHQFQIEVDLIREKQKEKT